MNSKWRSQAPSNIALIKYMGKVNADKNMPTNASLSYTLNHLVSCVEIEASQGEQDHWEPLQHPEWMSLDLSDSGQRRFLNHFQFLKEKWNVKGTFVLRSANNFPHDAGVASSASSFAALTRATYQMALDLSSCSEELESVGEEGLADLSRQGSGSSCRSFYEPWALWTTQGVQKLETPLSYLHHELAVVAMDKKKVSSSEAHKRVVSSLLFSGRVNRAETRLKDLLSALNYQDWQQAFELTWAEFWDMHALFETSVPSFGYMNEGSVRILNLVKTIWQERGDGPLVTMDAGANVHLLYRPDQINIAEQIRSQTEDVKWLVSPKESDRG